MARALPCSRPLAFGLLGLPHGQSATLDTHPPTGATMS